MTNMDKLYASVAANGPVCVGLDTEFSYLPDSAAPSAELLHFPKHLFHPEAVLLRMCECSKDTSGSS